MGRGDEAKDRGERRGRRRKRREDGVGRKGEKEEDRVNVCMLC